MKFIKFHPQILVLFFLYDICTCRSSWCGRGCSWTGLSSWQSYHSWCKCRSGISEKSWKRQFAKMFNFMSWSKYIRVMSVLLSSSFFFTIFKTPLSLIYLHWMTKHRMNNWERFFFYWSLWCWTASKIPAEQNRLRTVHITLNLSGYIYRSNNTCSVRNRF